MNYNLFIDSNTGYFCYSHLLFDMIVNKGTTIKSESDAKKIAINFMLKSSDYLKEAPGLVGLFKNLIFTNAYSISLQNNPKAIYWVVKFIPTIKPSTKEENAPVINAGITIKIGGKNQIIGIDYLWLPIAKTEIVRRFSYTFKDKQGNDIIPSIIYKVEQELNIVAPYIVAKSNNKKLIS